METTDKKEAFEETLRSFYQVIKDCEASPGFTIPMIQNRTRTRVNGALFFAVFRGKVSEGMNFADNNARIVLRWGGIVYGGRRCSIFLFLNREIKRGFTAMDQWLVLCCSSMFMLVV